MQRSTSIPHVVIVVALLACGCGKAYSQQPGDVTDAGTAVALSDGGGGGRPPTAGINCTLQPENVRVTLCDTTQPNELYACDASSPPPRADCVRAVHQGSYCCPVARSTPTNDASAPPPPEGTYYAACLTQLAAAGEAKDLFHFYVELKPASLVLQSIRVSAEDGQPPARVAEADLVGDRSASRSATPDASGRLSYAIDAIEIPGAANPIAGNDVLIREAVVLTRLRATESCSALSGRLEQPHQLDLDEKRNTCALAPYKLGDPRPMFDVARFQAGCQ